MKRMKTHVGGLALAVAAALAVAGCQQDDPEEIGAYDTGTQELSQREIVNYTQLRTAPPAVRQSFRQEHGRVSVTGVERLTTDAGRPLYQVTFIRIPSGDPENVYYNMAGEKMDFMAPGQEQAVPDAAQEAAGELQSLPPESELPDGINYNPEQGYDMQQGQTGQRQTGQRQSGQGQTGQGQGGQRPDASN